MNEKKIKIQLLTALLVPLALYGITTVFDYVQESQDILQVWQLADFNVHGDKQKVEQAKVLLQEVKIAGVTVSDINAISDPKMRTVAGEDAEQIQALAEAMEKSIKNRFWGTLIFFAVTGVFFFAMAFKVFQSISEMAQAMRLLLDHTAQGFMLFDRKGKILPGYSKASEVLFGEGMARAHALELSGVDAERRESSLESLFNEPLPFEDVAALLPSEIETHGRAASLQYRAIRNSRGHVSAVLFVATDVTELREAEKEALRERDLNRSLVKIIGRKRDFLDLVHSVEQLDQSKGDLTTIKIQLHSLKSTFAMFSLSHLSEACHLWETRIAAAPTPETVDQTVDDLQEQLRNFIYENHHVLNLEQGADHTITIPKVKFEGLMHDLERIHAPIQMVEQVRHWVEKPPQETLKWLSDAFCETAVLLGKEAKPIEWLPSDDIDPNAAPEMFQTLVHLVRNAADHGIETPSEREALGKSRAGQLWAQLLKEKDYVMMTFFDDGQGVSVEHVRRKAEALGITVPAEDSDVIDLIFRPDFSTKEEVTEISGRGVGLCAIREEARARGGDIRVENRPGGGAHFRVWFKLRRVSIEGSGKNVAA